MCGVIGAVGPGSEAVVEAGIHALSHRGIRHRTMSTRWGTIGHTRLPIVGVGGENDQPVLRGKWLVAFVGEILDFREYRPGAECDLDTVVDTWSDDGPRGFCKHDGFWTVMALDSLTGDLHVIVDYLAQKPAYVRSDRYARAAASEPNALSCLGPTTPDEIYFASVIKWGYCPETHRTPYREIRKMIPGEHLVIHYDGSCDVEITDDLQAVPTGPSVLRAELEASVRRRVCSADVPVAALVSGGLDSAIVWMLARRSGDVQPYHVENNEVDEAREVLGADWPRVQLATLGGVDLTKALTYMQEPLDLGSLYPQVALSDAIAEARGERVCLTGDGVDELFGGYSRAHRYDSQSSDVWHELVSWHLPRLDRVMMRNRIEIRSPFLSRRVAGAAIALPRGMRTGKKILRDMFSQDLPRGITTQPKRALRTADVEIDREGHSMELVGAFRRMVWPTGS